MRIVLTENITLDGVVEATDGWFAPAGGDEIDQSDLEDELRNQMARESGLLLGRVTFEEFRGYWPAQVDDPTGITEHLNRVQKYVLSNSLVDPGWENTRVLSGSLRDEIRALRDAPGEELGITGSISVAHQLIDAGLVDEYRLFVYPVVVGRGRRLFADSIERADLRLADVKSFRAGVVLLTYRS